MLHSGCCTVDVIQTAKSISLWFAAAPALLFFRHCLAASPACSSLVHQPLFCGSTGLWMIGWVAADGLLACSQMCACPSCHTCVRARSATLKCRRSFAGILVPFSSFRAWQLAQREWLVVFEIVVVGAAGSHHHDIHHQACGTSCLVSLCLCMCSCACVRGYVCACACARVHVHQSRMHTQTELVLGLVLCSSHKVFATPQGGGLYPKLRASLPSCPASVFMLL